MTSQSPIHLLMRFSDKLYSVKDTIGEHKNIISLHGAVWIAKIGKSLSLKTINAINEQCAQMTPSYLYLVQRNGSRLVPYCAIILKMASSLPENENQLIPQYYRDRGILKQSRLWIKVSQIKSLEVPELNNIHIAASGMAVSRTLNLSTAGLFIVKEGVGISG